MFIYDVMIKDQPMSVLPADPMADVFFWNMSDPIRCFQST